SNRNRCICALGRPCVWVLTAWVNSNRKSSRPDARGRDNSRDRRGRQARQGKPARIEGVVRQEKGDAIMNQYDLKGRVAVVTGGAQGIGYAVTQRLLAGGAKVAI